ncbi:protein RGF1 INDUCIBLE TRANSCRIPTION FACTOR 1-like [Actinidia eriantha]|uniref:protein RGF1 INDUCIBLE TRANSCRIPTION FACTOR 1-like n=1 Tax=Actinidia eriantha TaxID=165200 RepID=UPI00258B5581|nr:protein RGF1 INDUCIBLE TRANSCRIPTION FACTOR 1-like [Actinidia eriantha]
MMEEEEEWPAWVRPLLKTSFFGPCKQHASASTHGHKSECNMYCLHCNNGSLCSLCLASPSHKHHPAIQIRRSSYHDVIRASEIQKFMDITGVQTYIINAAKIVFLNERPQPRPAKGLTNTNTNTNTCRCLVCHRTLLHSFAFCSLACKIVGTSKNFHKEKLCMEMGRSDSEKSNKGHGHGHGRIIKNKIDQMSFTPSTPPQAQTAAKRRKGVPHRAPMAGVLLVQY